MDRRLALASALFCLAPRASAQPPFALVETDCADAVEAALAADRSAPAAGEARATSPDGEGREAETRPASARGQVASAEGPDRLSSNGEVGPRGPPLNGDVSAHESRAAPTRAAEGAAEECDPPMSGHRREDPAAATPASTSTNEEGTASSRPEGPPPLPDGFTLANLAEAPCLALLRAHRVPFVRLPAARAEGVGIPIRLEGSLGGVRIESRGHSELHEILDCRLAVALLRWAPALRRAGVRELLHYSTYRPGARVARTGRVSGHAHALAIDVSRLVFEDGSVLDVLDGWESRERGAAPCEGVRVESERSAELRRLVCGIAPTFQIVLTPHYDAAHANHVHLELRPGVRWTYLH